MSSSMSARFSVASKSNSRSRTILRRRTLEDTLLNEEERAAIQAIDASLTSQDDSDPLSYRVYTCCSTFFCNRAFAALLFMAIVLVVGVGLFGITQIDYIKTHNANETERRIRIAGAFLISAGLFGLLGGITNILALLMLFYEIPLLFGTGVMQRQHKQISNVICRITVQMLFDSEHLKNYILERISKFSVDVNILECITKGLNSSKAGVIINEHLDSLYSHPEAQYLSAMGISRSLLTPMIRPAILSLCAETAPFVLTHDTEEHAVNIPKLQDAITGFLLHRVQALSKNAVSVLMRQLIFRHLLGLVMYGCIMGCVIGLLAQSFQFSLNPEIGK